MARLIDPNSNRQKGYRVLSAILNTSKKEGISTLIDVLDLVEQNLDLTNFNTKKTKPAKARAMKKARSEASKEARTEATEILDGMLSKNRVDCLIVLMALLDIDEPYASTLFADFRKKNKDNGCMVTVYRILEKRSTRGKITPYVSETSVFNAKDTDCTSLEDAKNAYIQNQENSIKHALTL